MIKLYLVAMLLASCVYIGPDNPTIETLPYGQDEAVYAGCVRGVIRWHYNTTGSYPSLDIVHRHCEEIRRSYNRQQRDNKAQGI